MTNSYFDHNRNLQIHGDVTFVSSGGPTQDNRSFFHVGERVRGANAQSRTFERGFKILCESTAPSARYGSGQSFTGPQCHPGTRIVVQDHIFKWLDDSDGPIAMWMNGSVGIGKSAIAQTVAHLAAERGQLSSAFFFFRSDDTRNSAKHLVPTLVYEMTQQMPHTRDHVCQSIAANPLIFSSPLEHQIVSTLLRPLCSPFEAVPRGHMLIIIDGLDECIDIITQQAIIRSFLTSLLSLATQLLPHKLLIVSRPESHITSAFSAAAPYVETFALDPWNTGDDIEIFLRAKLDEIKQTHPLKHYLPDVWPDFLSFFSLRGHSAGSFAYASAVIRYLASHHNNPERALHDLLALQPTRAAAAFADLDSLYRHILLNLEPEILFTLQKVLCLHLYSFKRGIESLAARLSEEQFTVEAAIICASSLIQIHDDFGYRCIRFHHSSFEEFLRDKERSRELYVFSDHVATAVASALSNLWLHPIPDVEEYSWFECVGQGIRETKNMDMAVHVLATLVETNLPVSFLSVKTDKLQSVDGWVTSFFHAIKSKSACDSDSIHGPLYNQAFNVVCAWLRLHLNLFFQGTATFEDILAVIPEDSNNANGIVSNERLYYSIFCHLTADDLHDGPAMFKFHCICRVFPEMDRLEIYCCILERYLALPSDTRKNDMIKDEWELTLTGLYFAFLGSRDAMVPNFSQRLEQIVLAGQNAFGPVRSVYMTSKDCIFHFFCGSDFYVDGEYQLTAGNEEDTRQYKTCSYLAEETDRYIRRVHAELDFAYISEHVEASLYRSGPGSSGT